MPAGLKNPLPEIVGKAFSRYALDDYSKKKKAVVVVPPLLARLLDHGGLDPLASERERCRTLASGGLPPGIVIAARQVSNAGSVAEQLCHCHPFRTRALVNLWEQHSECAVEPELVLLHELHHEGGGKWFAQRTDTVSRCWIAWNGPFDISFAISPLKKDFASTRNQGGSVKATMHSVAVEELAQGGRLVRNYPGCKAWRCVLR